MYLIEFEFSFREEKFEAVKMVEQSRQITMCHHDLPNSIKKAIQDIATVLTANLYARGGALEESILVSTNDLMVGGEHALKCILIK